MKQITLMNQEMNVATMPDGTRLLQLTDRNNGDITLVPMDEKAADTIGKKLCAPSVLMPGSGLGLMNGGQ